ncbi:unnamed protein product [Microthlaspi erraticum]|uniref:Uncharacterized protein n=1 Tax=Microthlaspi erraticum TaxID=1685480 RepID=A0A6D2JMH9_9BRAS|nr:unnamed protein product [Microthlaspi erraticum]
MSRRALCHSNLEKLWDGIRQLKTFADWVRVFQGESSSSKRKEQSEGAAGVSEDGSVVKRKINFFSQAVTTLSKYGSYVTSGRRFHMYFLEWTSSSSSLIINFRQGSVNENLRFLFPWSSLSVDFLQISSGGGG